MKQKFNEFENYLIKEGIYKIQKDLKKEIKDVEDSGKRHIMSQNYVDIIVKDLFKKLETFTKVYKKK